MQQITARGLRMAALPIAKAVDAADAAYKPNSEARQKFGDDFVDVSREVNEDVRAVITFLTGLADALDEAKRTGQAVVATIAPEMDDDDNNDDDDGYSDEDSEERDCRCSGCGKDLGSDDELNEPFDLRDDETWDELRSIFEELVNRNKDRR
jgi:hypothetical protein